MLVAEVDRVDAEPPQARVAGFPDIFRAPAVAALLRIQGVAHDTELGGHEDRFPPPRNGAPDKFLVSAKAIHVGGIEKISARIEVAPDRGCGFRIVAPAVKIAHAHAAEPQC